MADQPLAKIITEYVCARSFLVVVASSCKGNTVRLGSILSRRWRRRRHVCDRACGLRRKYLVKFARKSWLKVWMRRIRSCRIWTLYRKQRLCCISCMSVVPTNGAEDFVLVAPPQISPVARTVDFALQTLSTAWFCLVTLDFLQGSAFCSPRKGELTIERHRGHPAARRFSWSGYDH